jgi:hypothetical protein
MCALIGFLSRSRAQRFETDHSHQLPRPLPCAGRERPCLRDIKERDAFAPFQFLELHALLLAREWWQRIKDWQDRVRRLAALRVPSTPCRVVINAHPTAGLRTDAPRAFPALSLATTAMLRERRKWLKPREQKVISYDLENQS